MAKSNPYTPLRADHRFIRNVLDMSHAGKVVHVVTEYDRICRVFVKAGGSWEKLFLGSVKDVNLLKKVIKIAVKNKILTPSGGW